MILGFATTTGLRRNCFARSSFAVRVVAQTRHGGAQVRLSSTSPRARLQIQTAIWEEEKARQLAAQKRNWSELQRLEIEVEGPEGRELVVKKVAVPAGASPGQVIQHFFPHARTSIAVALADGLLHRFSESIRPSTLRLTLLPLWSHERLVLDACRLSSAYVFAAALDAIFGDRVLLSGTPHLTEKASIPGSGWAYDFLDRGAEGDAQIEDDETASLRTRLTNLLSPSRPSPLLSTPRELGVVERHARGLQIENLPFDTLRLSFELARRLFEHQPFKLEYLQAEQNRQEKDGEGDVVALRLGSFFDLIPPDRALVPRTGFLRALMVERISAESWAPSSSSFPHPTPGSIHLPMTRATGLSFPHPEQLASYVEGKAEGVSFDPLLIGRAQELFTPSHGASGRLTLGRMGVRVAQRLSALAASCYEGHCAPGLAGTGNFPTKGQKPENGLVSGWFGENDMPRGSLEHDGSSTFTWTASCDEAEFPAGLTTYVLCLKRFLATLGLSDCFYVGSTAFGGDTPLKVASQAALLNSMADGELQILPAQPHPKEQVLGPSALQASLNIFARLRDGKRLVASIWAGAVVQSEQRAESSNHLPTQDISGAKGSTKDELLTIRHKIWLDQLVSLLAERDKGDWPFWLSPNQACVIGVGTSEANAEAARVAQSLSGTRREGETGASSPTFYVDLSPPTLRFSKAIRRALAMGYHYVLVIGEEELRAGVINVRARNSKDMVKMTLEEVRALFAERIRVDEAEGKKIDETSETGT